MIPIPAPGLRPPESGAHAIRAPRLPTFDAPPGIAASPHPEPRLELARMGAWVFSIVEASFFGGLFVLYAILHAAEPQVFVYGRFFLDPRAGAMQTCILLSSAALAAFAVRAAHSGDRRRATGFVRAALVLAVLAVSAQVGESADLAGRGLLPGARFTPTEAVWETSEFRREHPRAAAFASSFRPGARSTGRASAADEGPDARLLAELGVLGPGAIYPTLPSRPWNAHVFFGLFHLITVLHGAHVVAGAVAFAWLLLDARQRRPAALSLPALEAIALWWSAVTAIRVLSFPLLYLVH